MVLRPRLDSLLLGTLWVLEAKGTEVQGGRSHVNAKFMVREGRDSVLHPPTWSGAAHLDRYKLLALFSLPSLPWASVSPSEQQGAGLGSSGLIVSPAPSSPEF